VLTALARDPDERYPTAAEFALALRRAITQPEQGAPPVPAVVTFADRGGAPPWPTTHGEKAGPGGQPPATVPGQTPLATTPAGATPQAAGTQPATAPTATPTTPSATPRPSSALSMAPTPLVLVPKDSKPCKATQIITNNTGQMVGWAWQQPKVGGLHFQIERRPPVDWPASTTYTPPGGQNTLTVTGDCHDHPCSYSIVVKDTVGGDTTSR
jgi:hypothetical protein